MIWQVTKMVEEEDPKLTSYMDTPKLLLVEQISMRTLWRLAEKTVHS